jgi:hypothetical protein
MAAPLAEVVINLQSNAIEYEQKACPGRRDCFGGFAIHPY